ncbi:MAG: hypothetical protein QOE96_2277 [Blastocatellia bacterium]|jgi:hypothetical protein|nr:hypothetical protein [Blastocatellia bacterium]
MIALISSAGEEIYKQFVLQVLCYPTGHILPDVPYSLDRVANPFDQSPSDLVDEKEAVIVLVDYVPTGNLAQPLQPLFLPLRKATISRASRFAGKLLLDVRLGEYCYYDDNIKNSYIPASASVTPRFWSGVIGAIDQSPRPMPTSPGKAIDPADRKSWMSTGNFVLKIGKDAIDFRVLDARGEKVVRDECEDWKSVVDMVTRTGQFEDKLFYQISGLRRPDSEVSLSLLTVGDRSVYQLTAGDSAELVLHFYQGRKRQATDKSVLQTLPTTLS